VRRRDTIAETSARVISNIKFAKVVMWEGAANCGATSGFLQSMARTPMMQVMRDIGGVELPTFGSKDGQGWQPRHRRGYTRRPTGRTTGGAAEAGPWLTDFLWEAV
jgi:hypothetical protein